jgi:hypothetical protein
MVFLELFEFFQHGNQFKMQRYEIICNFAAFFERKI